MKYTLLFAGFVLFQMINSAYGGPQSIAACASELGIPLEAMKNGLMANMEKAEFRCILACILKKDGILQSGNTINTALLKQEGAPHFGSNIDEVVKAGADCANQYKSTADECDFINSVIVCFLGKIPDVQKMFKP